jgi:hypothetical protein
VRFNEYILTVCAPSLTTDLFNLLLGGKKECGFCGKIPDEWGFEATRREIKSQERLVHENRNCFNAYSFCKRVSATGDIYVAE